MDHSGDRQELVRSLNSDHRAYVRFRNNTVRKVDVIWINYEGSRVKYRTLLPGQFFDANTYLSHPWMFRDSDTQDKLVVKSKEVFRPPPSVIRSVPNEGNAEPVRRLERTIVYITIPVYTLKERAMQVIRSYISQPDRVCQLELPVALKNELMSMMREHCVRRAV
ncbi:von Hippel-Lindau disease tumor suppressor [Ischnura elegans]|uniref:von Hippel-Lindau disease tumor suppressor n=1 Tax=Ischnura elegans TaxID=197161 RepID=UPI001ED8A1E1|nr:von Hippel-Lindau disease tumor suppressor [Ischnura elegans]